MTEARRKDCNWQEIQVANWCRRGRGRDRPWEHQGREGGIEYREMRHQPMHMNIVSSCLNHMSPHSHLVAGQRSWVKQVKKLTRMTALVAPWRSPLALALWGTWRDDMFSLIGMSGKCACKRARRNREADGRKDAEGRTE